MKPKHYTPDEILENANVGIEFEFYSKISPEKLGKLLSKELNKKVIIPKIISNLDSKKILIYHSDVKVTSEIFKLEADYSGGFDMYELITGQLSYSEARKIIIKVLDWISVYGFTNERCSIHLNISFNNFLKSTNSIIDMNIVKFLLNFDEKRVYKEFPKRENSVYAKSIKKDISHKIYFQQNIPSDFDLKNIVNLPNEKYYGINFLKKEKNYLEFRYLGGKDYENKTPAILRMLDFFIQSLFQNINHPEYSKEDREKLQNLFTQFQQSLQGFNNYLKFKENNKKIKITIDLIDKDQNIITYWEAIKYQIFDLVSRCHLKEGNINYDTEVGKLQLFNCDLQYTTINNYDIVECNITNTNINNCELFYNKIDNCIVSNSNAIRENEFENSKIKETNIYATNICTNCVIENNQQVINGEYIGGIIRKGTVGALAKLQDTIQVEKQIESNSKNKDKFVKNWKWIKSLKK